MISIRFKHVFLFFLLAGLMACREDDVTTTPSTFVDPASVLDDPSITTINGTWKVVFFADASGRVTGKTKENSWDKDITFTFDDTKTPHFAGGIITTNSAGGEFRYVDPRKIHIDNLMSTEVGQPQWADKFESLIISGDLTFTVNERRLVIYRSNKSESIILDKQ